MGGTRDRRDRRQPPFFKELGFRPVAQVRARFAHIQARKTRFSGANLGFAIFRSRQPQMS
jgi:hypothetical protein